MGALLRRYQVIPTPSRETIIPASARRAKVAP
jgi:hypothetical protein